VKIRFITPSILQFVLGISTFSSNYTNATFVANSGYAAEIDLPRGFLFPDFVAVNLSLVVDPDQVIPVGAEMSFAPIVVFPTCQQSVFAGFPSE